MMIKLTKRVGGGEVVRFGGRGANSIWEDYVVARAGRQAQVLEATVERWAQ